MAAKKDKSERATYALKEKENAFAREGNCLVVIEPDLFAVFPSAEAVNAALALLVKASKKATNSKAARQARAKLEAQA